MKGGRSAVVRGVSEAKVSGGGGPRKFGGKKRGGRSGSSS